MKKILTIAMLIAAGTAMDVSAQIRPNLNINTTCKAEGKYGNQKILPIPHRSHKPHRGSAANVTYEAASTVLTVKFLSNSQGGTIEVFHDGAKVAGVTTNGGTTFSCVLRDYGTGSYNVIVSNGNTVIDSKNYTVK